jgi:hypothetical protein
VVIAGIVADDHYLFLRLLFEQPGIQINNALAVDRISSMNKGFDAAAHMHGALQI